ncbi:MAG: heavy-metal-associated domain-containing protein [Bacteroidota bacterium]
MKTIMIIALLMVVGTTWGQKTSKTQTIVIHTSAECGQCEERLESGLNFTKGVSFAELNLETQDVTIKYSTKKITPEKLRTIINELGYDADGTKAKPEALEKLPACCKPGGMEKHE